MMVGSNEHDNIILSFLGDFEDLCVIPGALLQKDCYTLCGNNWLEDN